MKIIQFLFAWTIVLLYNASLFSQGNYLKNGQNALGIFGCYESGKDYSAISGSASFSMFGNFDFGVSFAKAFFDRKLALEELNALEIAPKITFHAIKQDLNMPLSFSIFASYFYHSYISKALDQRNMQMIGNGYSVGAMVYTDVNFSQSITFQTSIGINNIAETLELSVVGAELQTSSDDATYYNLGFSLFGDISPMTIIAFHPSVLLYRHEPILIIELGFVAIIGE